jgi:hypothetical protein
MNRKDYFSMLKSSVIPKCPAGLLIWVQPNTHIEKTEHFWTSLHLVKERGQLNKGYNMQEVWEIQPSFASVYCVVSGLCNKPHWQDFPSNRSVIKALVKCKTKQSCLRTFFTTRGPHLIPGELLSITEQDALIINNRIFKDTGLYTIVIPSTSLLPTLLEHRCKWTHESSWADILFQYHFGCRQVRIKMRLGPI